MLELEKIIDEIIEKGLKEENITKESFHKIKNEIYKQYHLEKPLPSIQILERYNTLVKEGKKEENFTFKKILRKREVRSLS